MPGLQLTLIFLAVSVVAAASAWVTLDGLGGALEEKFVLGLVTFFACFYILCGSAAAMCGSGGCYTLIEILKG